MFLSKFAIRKPITMLMIFLLIIVIGFFSIKHIPISLLPNINYPKLTVSAGWTGVSPEEVEKRITSQIEAVGSSVNGVTDISSTSYGNYSIVEFTFDRKTNINYAKFELNEKLQTIKDKLPANVIPRITEYTPSEFQTDDFLSYGISGPYELGELKEYVDNYLKYKILAISGVSNVSIRGYIQRVFKIKINKDKSDFISPRAIRSALYKYGKSVSIANFKKEGKDFIILVDDRFKNINDIKRLKVSLKNGNLIELEQIATISEEKMPTMSYYRYNGNPQIILSIDKKNTANSIKLAKRIKKIVNEQTKLLPKNIDIIKLSDESKKILSDLNVLYKRGILAIIAISLVLLLFLRHIQSVFLVLTTIFFSTLLTIILLYSLHIGLNMLSLAGLTMGFGMMVDNSIVVYENIFRHQSLGYDRKTALIDATSEVALPIFASTLTTVIVFAPFLYLQGDLKLFYLPFVYATVISLLASLVVSFTFIPLVANKFLNVKISQAKSKQSLYAGLLSFFIKFRWIWLVLVLGFLSYSIWVFIEKVDKGFSWTFPEDNYLSIYISLPVGSNIDQSDYIAKHFEEKILESGYKVKMKTKIHTTYAYIRVDFDKETEKTAVPLIIREKLKAYAVNFGNSNIFIRGFGPSFGGGSYISADHSFEIKGYNYERLKLIAQKLKLFMKSISRRVSDIDINAVDWWKSEKLYRYEVTFLRDKLAKYNLDIFMVMNKLYSKIMSSQNNFKLKLSGKEKNFLILEDTKEDYYSIEQLKNLIIKEKGSVKLSDVAKIEKREIMSEIRRKNKQYTKRITYEFRGSYRKVEKFEKNLRESFKMPLGFYFVKKKDNNFGQKDNNKQLIYLLVFAVLLVYMTLCSLYESFKYPFLILFAIPLAFTGVSMIFYLTGETFDSYAKIGVVLLAGIVVNNSIILVDHINKLREKGLKVKDAVIQASKDRIRPILMTTLTTITGLLPMLLNSNISKNNFWKMLSLSSIGGLITSTFFVLTFIPIAYYFLTKKKGM